MSIEAQPEPTRVALYMRASTEMQKYSVQQQNTLLTTYAAARGYLIVRSYIDDGCSGLTLAGFVRGENVSIYSHPQRFELN